MAKQLQPSNQMRLSTLTILLLGCLLKDDMEMNLTLT